MAQEEINFDKYRTWSILCSALLIIWYLFDIDLSQYFNLNNQNINPYLHILLIVANIYFLLESILEYKKIDNEKSLEIKIQFYSILIVWFLAIFISYPKFIANTSLEYTDRIDLLVILISGFFLMISIASIKDSIEFIIIFYKFRKRLMLILFIPFVISLTLFYLAIIFFYNYSSIFQLYNFVILFLSMLITYIFFINKGRLIDQETFQHLSKLNNYLNRRIEVSDSISNNEKKKLDKIDSVNTKHKHKKIIKHIKKNQNNFYENHSFRFELCEEIGIENENENLKLKKYDHDKVIVHTEIYNETTNEVIEEENIEFKYLEKAIENFTISQIEECDTHCIINNLVMHALKFKKYDKSNRNEILMGLAYEGRDKEIIELLEYSDINIDYIAENSWSPLLIATAEGHYKTVKLLLDNAAEVNIENAYGATPLLFASKYGKKRLTKLLIEYNADLDHQDMENRTALMWATIEGHINIVKLLLEYNANKLLLSKENQTALDYAKKARLGKIYKLLKK